MAKRFMPKKIPGATSPRRHDDDVRKQLDQLRREHFPTEAIDGEIRTNLARNPHKEVAVRRIVRGFAHAETIRTRPMAASVLN